MVQKLCFQLHPEGFSELALGGASLEGTAVSEHQAFSQSEREQLGQDSLSSPEPGFTSLFAISS